MSVLNFGELKSIMSEKDCLSIELVERPSKKFLDWATALISSANDHIFSTAKVIATRLGAHYRSDGLTEIAFWVPEVEINNESFNTSFPTTHHQLKTSDSVYLKTFTPLQPIDFRAREQVISFHRQRLPLYNYQGFFCGVYSGMSAGTKEKAGTFYCLQYIDSENQIQTINDILAYSIPYGVFAAAEVYDIDRLQQNRQDLSYFSRAEDSDSFLTKVHPPQNILQIHVGTASPAGTLEGLTRIYQQIAKKLKNQVSLTPAEQNYIGYDAVQLLPIEPVAEYQTPDSPRPGFVSWDQTISPDAKHVEICLRKPDTQNWGYDIVLNGSSAINPSLLGSLRPDELIEFIATLHNFPTGPIQLIYDLVYGHSDNQGKDLLNSYFLQGANMYGQDVNHQHPVVRAILLEMQRRKINTGADGIRVDGAQDFKFFNPTTNQVEYDDAYLKEMSNVRQKIGQHQRQLFAIFEDGRPWPAEGWQETSTYLDVIKKQPEAYQWGPLIFAHNTPSLNNFWDSKWKRVCEVMKHGSHWISGCANHDTMRRGTQIDPQSDINWNLGQTLQEVIKNAYDNPAVTLLFNAFSPGIPMDFLNATMRAPWCFFRNTDNYYGLKVVTEEVRFLDWQVEPQFYNEKWVFTGIKQLGVKNFEDLRLFMSWLNQTVTKMKDQYDLETLSHLCQEFLNEKRDNPPKITVPMLKLFAKAYMEDCHHLCNVAHFWEQVTPEYSNFNLSVRNYRHAHPWLKENLTQDDKFDRLRDDQFTIFYGLRTGYNKEKYNLSERVAIVTHMGGKPAWINLEKLLGLDDLGQWRVAIATPGLKINPQLKENKDLKLKDSQGLLLEKVLLT